MDFRKWRREPVQGVMEIYIVSLDYRPGGLSGRIRPLRRFSTGATLARMKGIVLVLAAMLVHPAPAAAASAEISCGIPSFKWGGELQRFLSQRAVEAMSRAASVQSGPDGDLDRLIAPTAAFSFGVGDVGGTLGTGVAGARLLAKYMNADSYRFLGWDTIPSPVQNACGQQRVDVEFTDSASKRVYPVRFTFDGGRIAAADGWTRSYDAGPMGVPRQ